MTVVEARFARAGQRRIPRPPESPPSLLLRGKAVHALPPFQQSRVTTALPERGCVPPKRDQPQQIRPGQCALDQDAPARSVERDHGATSRRTEDSRAGRDRDIEHCANEPRGFFPCGEPNSIWALGACLALALLFVIAPLSSPAAVREVGAIRLTVGDLDRALAFYTKILPFEEVSQSMTAVGEADDLMGLGGTQLRIAELKLGDERITLTEHLTNKGRLIPADSRSFDHWFQHIAIVVSDMDKAYEHLRRHKVKHVSTAPQTLPAWNREAGGIRAFYFRDPEDHVLEIIWFPPGKGDPKWQHRAAGIPPAGHEDGTARGTRGSTLFSGTAGGTHGGTLFLGIDHTAIVVSDTDRSLEFYRDALGLRVAGGAENHGVEQEHLNQVFGARLRITALRAEHGPGIEFLEYIAPPGGRPLPPDAQANDLVFWQTQIFANGLAELIHRLREQRSKLVSRSVVAWPAETSNAHRTVIARDPDGHALQFIERGQGNNGEIPDAPRENRSTEDVRP